MTRSPNQPDRDLPRLSPADAEVFDRLLAGEPIAAFTAPGQAERAGQMRRLLDVLGHWPAQEPGLELSKQTLTNVLVAQRVSLSEADGEVLDALLSLRRQGLTHGPMPAGSRERAEKLNNLLGLLARPSDEPVPKGLVGRTMQAVQADRAKHRRLSIMSDRSSLGETGRGGFGGLRQVGTIAALVLMSLSVLLPVLSKSRNDAQVAQCKANLAGLGTDLKQFADDNDQQINFLQTFFGSTQVDGTPIPPSEMNVFALFDEHLVDQSELVCPSAADPDVAYYNGQNPVAGGPVRLFAQARPVFADTNPLYRLTGQGLVRKADTPDLAQSSNHEGAGQNVLISDGSVQWFIRPTFGTHRDAGDEADNIWLMRQTAGDVLPDQDKDQPDVFLTP